jgi:uncharacterized protein YggU (UPF0235/DUF167 family)
MSKARGFCQKCGTTSSSEWRNITAELKPFTILTSVPAGRKRNAICSSCARSLRRPEPDPMVNKFPKRKRKQGETYTAPAVSRSPVAGKGNQLIFKIFGELILLSGLFATRNYLSNEVVTLYQGESLTAEEAEKRIGISSYLCAVSGRHIIDGANGWGGVQGLGRFINSCPKDGRNNCKFVNHFDKTIYLAKL